MDRLLSKAGWIFLGDGGAKLFGFFATLYLARTLGVEQFGMLSFAISLLGIFAWFTDLGINTVATREIAASTKNNKARAADFFWLKLILSLTVMLAAAIIIWFTFAGQPEIRALCLLFILVLLPQALQIDWYFRGIQEFKWITMGRWTQGTVYLGGLLLIVTSKDLLIVPIIYAASVLISSFVMIAAMKKPVSLLSSPVKAVWSRILKSGVKLGAGSFIAQAGVLLPYILLKIFHTDEIIGYYSAAFKIILVIMLADRVIFSLLLPNLSIKWQNPDTNLPLLFNRLVKWLLTAGSTGALLVIFTAEPVIGLLYGPEYLPAAPMLVLLSIFLPATFLNSVFMYALISAGEDSRYLKAAIRGGILAVAILVFTAAAAPLEVFIASVAISEIIFAYFAWRQFRLILKTVAAKIVILSSFNLLISIFLYFYLLPGIVIAIIGSVACFIITTFVFRVITIDDIEWIIRQIRS